MGSMGQKDPSLVAVPSGQYLPAKVALCQMMVNFSCKSSQSATFRVPCR